MWKSLTSTVKAHDSEDISTSRLALLFAVFISLGVWAFLSLKYGVVQDMPYGVVTMVLGLSGFKTVQRFGETGKAKDVLTGLGKVFRKGKSRKKVYGKL